MPPLNPILKALRCAIALLCVLVWSTRLLPAQNLIPNGGFEDGDVPSCTQGKLPPPWLSASPVTPGADVYSCDCGTLAGLQVNPGGSFAPGCPAPSGLRFIAGWTAPGFADAECMGVPLLAELEAGQPYRVSARILRSLNHPDSTGMDVFLSSDMVFDAAQDAFATTFGEGAGPTAWTTFTSSFEAPANSAGLGSFILVPRKLTAFTSSYQALDDIRLEPLAEVYCQPKVASNGCIPSISVVGVPSLTVGVRFLVKAQQVVSSKPGILIHSKQAAAVPFMGGTLCLGGTVTRSALMNSGGSGSPPYDCTGTFAYNFDQVLQSAGAGGFQVGDNAYAQYWFRDPQDAFGAGLSDAVRFEIVD